MFANRTGIRESNERTVLSVIVNDGPLSRANLSEKIGLNKASVSAIVKKLIEQNLIKETGIGESTVQGGRKPIMLELNKAAGFGISMDIGYDYIDTMVHYLDGTIQKRKLLPFHTIQKATIIAKLVTIIQEITAKLPKSPFGIVGLTIAIHGVIHDNQIIFTPAYDFTDFPLVEELRKHVDYPVFLENEANLLAMSEHAKNRQDSNLVCISIHAGVGAGIMMNDTLYTGENGLSGEIGHMIVQANGNACTCGGKGCLETYSSEKVILDAYREISKNPKAIIPDLYRAYTANDSIALKLIANMVDYLSIAVHNIITLYNPKVIAIHSEISRLIPDFPEKIKQQLPRLTAQNIEMKKVSLGEEAILFGASVVTISNFLEIPTFELKN
ncbi:ROK family transcriptional regulator [Paenilisteria rocourtiae]|uniref:Putative NBD/HSP70 family sugar kinase n=1 Tax=Listeria rocourtiae TaxID=647910 RepID=A0A4V3DP62_9LIST|nr:ROK family transcriptional regulator [Listeria rocourtiae]EUJ52296.1 xylose repressor [Listeria rocourtiae FSL F6-920]MBC1435147.1 ROK family transcriptional regulator [Listeria rocourtiae]MBC1605768.1 ROK family transcriptional regulator [Listeria rocourtiae]TDR51066.1 putative NBD/HSP70 family sugar kinase [Listeria rocourtiae]